MSRVDTFLVGRVGENFCNPGAEDHTIRQQIPIPEPVGGRFERIPQPFFTPAKGADRPLQSEAARATVLASLASVDMVVIFTEETPLALIEAIRPDVLVKGADYALEDVVGADVVQGYGGRVELAPVEPGYSTSATIARMAK